MALTPKFSHLAANAAADAVCALASGGFLDIYDGAQPATANTAVTSQVLLATMPLPTPAFGAAVNGVATANAIASNPSATATGTAAWCRVTKADHTTVLFDGSVGTTGCNLNLGSTSIVATGRVTINSLTYTQTE
jgi:hypothetical protein